jgi:hypothetical protein
MTNRSLLCLHLLVSTVAAFWLFSACCIQSPPPEQPSPLVIREPQPAGVEKEKSTLPPPDTGLEPGQNDICPQTSDKRKILVSEREHDQCYHVQPGAETTKKKGHRTTGRCQPQSLVYARCRTGVTACRLGDTSPVQWFSCARKNGDTTPVPTAGSIMVLDVNLKHSMSTGHPVYVEQVKANGNGTWLLRISHTNYDRKCHLDRDARVLFNPAHMTATFESGPWANWSCDLKVLGFILR